MHLSKNSNSTNNHKTSVLSSTTGTDEQEDCPSPKRQYENYLIATNKIHSEISFRYTLTYLENQ